MYVNICEFKTLLKNENEFNQVSQKKMNIFEELSYTICDQFKIEHVSCFNTVFIYLNAAAINSALFLYCILMQTKQNLFHVLWK